MSRGRHLLVATLAAILLSGCAIALSGCGGDGGQQTVKVTLSDFDLTFNPAIHAGRVRFEAKNDGGFVHEVAVIATDRSPDRLPRDAGGLVDERGPGVRVIDETGDVFPGRTAELTVDLRRGAYLLLCNKAAERGDPQSHFQHGMHQAFTVS